MKKLWIFLGLSLAGFSPATARESLGIFENWGAFSDPATPRCYAIAQPVKGRSSAVRNWQPFAAIGTWPRRNVRGQVHFRLSRKVGKNVAASVTIGDRRVALIAGGVDAWAKDRRGDAMIIAAIRSGTSMSVASVSTTGQPFTDVYALRGAATAIDAAALGCARLR